jgi:DnaJ family protein C protein 17
VSLQRAYDVLGDEQARAAYDELLRLQKERLQKENHLSAERQKMMQDLHDREHAHEIEKKAKVVEEQAAARLKVEIARIRKQRAQQQEKVPLFSDKRNLSVPSQGTAHHIDASDIDRTIKVTWACLEGGSGGYSAEQLKDIFKEFGEVEDIVIRQGKSRTKSSALLVMGSKEAVVCSRALVYPCTSCCSSCAFISGLASPCKENLGGCVWKIVIYWEYAMYCADSGNSETMWKYFKPFAGCTCYGNYWSSFSNFRAVASCGCITTYNQSVKWFSRDQLSLL